MHGLYAQRHNNAVSSDSNLHPFSTIVDSVTLRTIIPVPTSIPFGVFPRGVYDIYGSLGEGYITSTATSKSVTLSTSGCVTFQSSFQTTYPNANLHLALLLL